MFPYAETIQLTCLCAAVRFVRKAKAGYWRLFIPFLLLTLLVEVGGRLLARNYQSNHWLYNLFLPVQVFFMGWLFYKVYPSSFLTRKWYLAAFLIFLAGFGAESFQRKGMVYNASSDSLATFLFICLSGGYYFFLLKEESYTDLLHYAPFWFVSGVFLFHFGSMASVLFTDELMQLYVVGKLSLRYLIYLFLNLILYCCWMYAFKCKYQETISS